MWFNRKPRVGLSSPGLSPQQDRPPTERSSLPSLEAYRKPPPACPALQAKAQPASTTAIWTRTQLQMPLAKLLPATGRTLNPEASDSSRAHTPGHGRRRPDPSCRPLGAHTAVFRPSHALVSIRGNISEVHLQLPQAGGPLSFHKMTRVLDKSPSFLKMNSEKTSARVSPLSAGQMRQALQCAGPKVRPRADRQACWALRSPVQSPELPPAGVGLSVEIQPCLHRLAALV